jgi:Na+/H+-dicarboxylate symporter
MKKMQLSTKILIGLVAGIVAGILLQGSPDIASTWIKPFGTMFLLSLIHISDPRDRQKSRMPSSA